MIEVTAYRVNYGGFIDERIDRSARFDGAAGAEIYIEALKEIGGQVVIQVKNTDNGEVGFYRAHKIERSKKFNDFYWQWSSYNAGDFRNAYI